MAIETIEYNIDGNTPRDLKIVHVADIHKSNTKDIELLYQLLTMIKNNDKTPDAFIINGDIVDTIADFVDDTILFLKEAAQVVPTFVTLDSHDLMTYTKGKKNFDQERIEKLFKTLKTIQYLNVFLPNNNDVISLENNVHVFGYSLDHQSSYKRNLIQYLRNLNLKKDHYNIGAFHRSEVFKDKKSIQLNDPNTFGADAIDLTVFGHNHKGIFLLKEVMTDNGPQGQLGLIGIESGKKFLFPKGVSGIYQNGTLTAIIGKHFGKLVPNTAPYLIPLINCLSSKHYVDIINVRSR